MALLQIAEPGQSSAPHQRRLAAGIDLGTTNSLVATVRSGEPVTLPDAEGRHLLPSVVRYRSEAVVVGFDAEAAALDDPLGTISSVKRLMGRGIADIKSLGARLPYEFRAGESEMPLIRTAGGDVSPVEVSAEILRSLARRAEDALGGPLEGVVITVPAYFDDAQRQATKDAARLAGLQTLRLLNEPTAAAVAYGLDRGADGVHAIYDLGGGTFDISILRLHRGVFEVLSTGGDTALGGDDFDRAVARWMMKEAGVADDLDLQSLKRIQSDARTAKVALSAADQVDVSVERPDGTTWQGTLSRKVLDALLDPLIGQTLTACGRALRDAGIARDEIADVVMVGGSTRILRVRQRVGEFFGRPPLVDLDPDRVVALGAAVQADILVGNKPDAEMLLLDVIPLSLGIETMGGLVERIVPRNTTIPVARAQEFTTYRDGQTAMAVHVLQGERDLVSDCRSLARFELRGFPPMVAGAARIRVTFEVDADGLLTVSAVEQSTEVQASVAVKPSYGLSDSEIERMLRDSIEHANEDVEARKLREQQVEGARVLEALDAALGADGDDLLNVDERAAIHAAAEALREAVRSEGAERIARRIRELEQASAGFVERRMNAGIRKAMAGRQVSEFD